MESVPEVSQAEAEMHATNAATAASVLICSENEEEDDDEDEVFKAAADMVEAESAAHPQLFR